MEKGGPPYCTDGSLDYTQSMCSEYLEPPLLKHLSSGEPVLSALNPCPRATFSAASDTTYSTLRVLQRFPPNTTSVLY